MSRSDTHPGEPPAHHRRLAGLLNWLRAGVLGANDGIVSVGGIVVGVAGATADRTVILTAGVAGLLAGALSMAAGEYVSVSSQRDAEQALLTKEKWELEHLPEYELHELTKLYEAKGVSPDLARQVATELTEHDALAAHAEAELGLDPNGEAKPWEATLASFAAFTLGSLLPLLAILLPPPEIRVGVCFVAVVLALALTGGVGARLGEAPVWRAVLRTVGGGAVAMAVTFGVGSLLGVNL